MHWAQNLPARAHARYWVAEDGDELVGWAEAELKWATKRDDLADVWVFVRTDRRGRGLGSGLYERTVAHVLEHGTRELKSGAWEDDGHRFLAAHGYERTRQERLSAVDPRTVDTSRLALPEGFELRSLGELRGRERELHELYSETAADMPADDPETNIGFDEWLHETLGDPTLSDDGSMVVLDGDTPVALAWIKVAGRRAENELTGTLPAYRRRGLARAAKLATIRWCAEQGIERIATENDSTNAGMLAINEELGYLPWITWQDYALRP